MTKARFFLTDLSQSSHKNDGGLIPDVWSVVFQNLEPSFLNSVLRTCRLFNAIAGTNEVFNALLSRYYPVDERQEGVSSYELFRSHYTRETSGLSRAARTLWDICYYEDVEQIEPFIDRLPATNQFDPDILFEVDANLNHLLVSHINRRDNQAIRDILFKRIYDWFLMQAKNKEWWSSFPLSLLTNQFTDSMTFAFETKKNHIIMDFAVALNQLSFIKQHSTHYTDTSSNKKPDFFQSACLFGHLEIVKYMLANGDPFRIMQGHHQDPLRHAVTGNQEEVVEFLLITHSDKITNDMMNSAICLAIVKDHITLLELLLSHLAMRVVAGEIVISDFTHNDGNTILDLACNGAKSEAGKLIDKTFPELLNADRDGYISSVCASGCTELIEYFLSEIDDIQQYLQAHPEFLVNAAASNSKAVTYLLDMGAPIDGRDDIGDTALHAATVNNHLAVVQLLVQRGADLSLRNAGNLTALQLAKTNKDDSIALFLMDAQFSRGRKRKAEAQPVVEDVQEPDHARPRR